MYCSKGYAPASFLKDINRAVSTETAVDYKPNAPSSVSDRGIESPVKAIAIIPDSSDVDAKEDKPPLRVAPSRPRPAARPIAAQSDASPLATPQPQETMHRPAPKAPSRPVRKARALYDFDGNYQPGCMSLKVGDEIILISATAGEVWWQGSCGSNIGSFPADYVQEIEAPSHPPIKTTVRKKS